MKTTLTNIDLENDSEAKRCIKDEVVAVAFASAAGELVSREGINSYRKGDALVIGSTGDCWSVSRDRFDAKYVPVSPLAHGADGSYRNKPIPVFAKQIHHAFKIARSVGGDLIDGKAGDWLMQYAPGDHGIVDAAKFRKVYRFVD